MKKLLPFLLAFVITGCKDIHCPNFPAQLEDYLPYSNAETLKFANINEDTISLIINNYWTSDNYSYKCKNDCLCEANKGFESELNKKYSIKIFSYITYYSESKHSTFICEFHDSDLNSDEFLKKEYYSSLNNSIFGDTIFIEKQEYYRFGSIKIVKGKGILEFWDKENDCFWIKVE